MKINGETLRKCRERCDGGRRVMCIESTLRSVVEMSIWRRPNFQVNRPKRLKLLDYESVRNGAHQTVIHREL